MPRGARSRESYLRGYETERRKKQEMRERTFVGAHRFVMGGNGRPKKKACARCGVRFWPRKPGVAREVEYEDRMFCSAECDVAYVRGVMETAASPRGVVGDMWSGDARPEKMFTRAQVRSFLRQGPLPG